MNSKSQPKINLLPGVKWVEKVMRLLIGYFRPSQNTLDSETVYFGEKNKIAIKSKTRMETNSLKNNN